MYIAKKVSSNALTNHKRKAKRQTKTFTATKKKKP